jgi:putative transport protein
MTDPRLPATQRWAAPAAALAALVIALVAWLAPPGIVVRFLGREHFILLFLVMAGGYLLGKVTVKGITMGPAAGSLVIAIGLSSWASARHGIHFELPPFASALFFNLFMFAIGVKVGPQFLPGLGRGAKNYVLLAVFVPIVAFGLALALGALVAPPPGVTVGLFAGANTATPALAAATAAIESGAAHLPEGTDMKAALLDMSTAFACSYCVSSVVFVVFIKVLPGLFGQSPTKDAREVERELSAATAPLPGGSAGFSSGALPAQQRTYLVEHSDFVGKSLGDLRREKSSLAIERIERGGEFVPLTDECVLMPGDHVSLFGRVPLLLEAAPRLGREVHDPGAPPMELQTVEVIQTNPAVLGRKLVELSEDVGHGLFLNAMFRAGEEIPLGSEVTIQKGDVLRVTATPQRLARLESRLGPVVHASLSTDLFTLALGLSLGALLGAITVPLGSVQFSLGSLALLLVGMALSTLRARNPALGGPFPEPARQLLEDLGLNVFVIILGLGSGAGLTRAIEVGAFFPLLLATLAVGLIPPLSAWALGLWGMKMHSSELLGAVAGARCSGSALRSAQEACQSTVPAIAYPVTYSLANLLFTLLTYVLVLLE